MGTYIFTTIMGAAVIELVSEFIPLSANSPLRKYLRYIIALVLAIVIVTPVAKLINHNGADIFSYFDNIPEAETSISEYQYICVTENAVSEPDALGNITSEAPLLCDLYIRECCLGIIEKTKTALADKFSVDADYINMNVSVDLTDKENIKEIKKGLNSCAGYIRGQLAKNLNLRITPELTFVEDTSLAYGAKIEKIISGFTYAEHPEDEVTETNAFDELLDDEDDDE